MQKNQAFMKAISNRNLNGVEEYISGVEDINAVLHDGMTPLVFTLSTCSYSWQDAELNTIILRLIDAGSDVNARHPSSNMTATMLAIKLRRQEHLIMKFIDAGTDLSLTCRRSKTVLIYAIENAYHKTVVPQLLAKGADADYPFTGYTPLYCALSFRNDPDIIEMLLRAGANINAADLRYKPLVAKCCRGRCMSALDEVCLYKRVTDLVIRKGADINECDDDGNTVIHLSTCSYVFFLATKNGVSIETKNDREETPLLQSLIAGNDEKVNYLLRLGANPNCAGEDGCTPLHNLWVICQERFVNLLIFHGADFLTKSAQGVTPFGLVVSDSDIYNERTLKSGIKMLIKNHLLYVDGNVLDEPVRTIAGPMREYFLEFIVACNKELSLMRDKLLKKELCFYHFCHLKKFYRDDYIPIQTHQYNSAYKIISVDFPIYKNLILMRLKDNRRKYFERELRRKVERIFIRQTGERGKAPEYHCLHFTSKYLNIKQLYILFQASIN